MTHPVAQTLDGRSPVAFHPLAVVGAADVALDDGRVDPRVLEQYRRDLTRYATWLLGSRAAAEDAVQDTLLAALGPHQGFSGRSSVRTWLFGILKHKIADLFRRQAREVPLQDDSDEDGGDAADAFTPDGRWRKPPSHWGDPEAALNRKQFLAALERCIDRLPANTARVFAMREILGMDTEEICAAVGITKDNCFVMLYRARVALRDRLSHDWFDAPSFQ